MVDIATNKLSKELKTEVSIKKVAFSLFNRADLQGIMIRDLQKDTLLYAGHFRLRITDWFFLKDAATIKFVGLEDAVIKLQRKDSVWNYAFIEDHFSSSDTTKKPSLPSNKKGFQLDLKKIDLKNVRFLQNDLWVGQRMQLKVMGLLADMESVDFNKGIFILDEVMLDRPGFSLADFDGLRPDSIRRKKKKSEGLYFNEGGIYVQAKKISLKNGYFYEDANLEAPEKGFDEEHLRFSMLNGNINDFSFQQDTIRANITLSAKEKSGFELRKLKAKFRLTPQIMEFANLDLQTNKSRLGNYYAMKYQDFNKDFNDYIAKVTMEARFSNADVHTDDIAFFAPELKDWHKRATISGKFLGTVEDFTVDQLAMRSGNSTVNGQLKMKGLPDIDKTLISFNNGTVQTNQRELSVIVPDLKKISSPDLAALGNVVFRGNFKGTISDFSTDGLLSTQLGSLSANLSMKLPAKAEPIYTGSLTTKRFNLGKFVSVPQLGIIDFNGKINGSSFLLDKLKTSIDGNFNSLEFNGYTYSNISTNGTFQKKYFNGELKIDDPNFDFTSIVEVDLSKADPRFNILGDIANADFQQLKFTNDKFGLSGLLDVNFTGNDIDQFLGTAKILNANLTYEGEKLAFDSASLQSIYEQGKRFLVLRSNEFSVIVTGEQYKILDLPNSLQAFFHNYFPSLIAKPAKKPAPQNFIVAIKTGIFEKYAPIINKKLSGLNYLNIVGAVNTSDTGSFYLLGDIPVVKYDQYALYNASINGSGNYKSLDLKIDIKEAQLGDSLTIPQAAITLNASNDKSKVHIKTSGINALNEADLFGDVFTLEDGFRLHFNPSSFVLNDKKWKIEKDGELVVRKNFVDAKNVKFTQGFQEISVETEEEDGGNTNNLIMKLNKVVLGDITQLFLKDPRLEGETSGDIRLGDFFGDFTADAQLKAEQFRFNDDSLGLVNVQAFYNSKNGQIRWNIQSPNDGYSFNSKGSYNLKDSIAPLNTTIDLYNSKIDLVDMFLSDLFTDIKGCASGQLQIKGNPEKPDLLGKISLRNAGLLVNYTQVYYTIDSAEIKFEEDGINIGEILVKDKYQNKGLVKGKLFEKGFTNMVFDFDMSTDKLLLIDTKQKDNENFYGRAIGKATMNLKGPESAAKMTLVAEANDSSHIYIPNSYSRESGDADFIVFKEYGTEIVAEDSSSGFNLSVDLDIIANNKVQIDVIIDDLTGDVIKATGNGRLRIKAGSTEPLTMKGRYTIEKGSYDFNFQSFIKKPFILTGDGNNYIEWNGDPFLADLHIDARYIAENINLGDLIGNQNYSFSDKMRGARTDVIVVAELRDKLMQPSIQFRLDFPQGSVARTDPSFQQFITRIERDEAEILKQVSYLIVFGGFAPQGGSNLPGGQTLLASTGINSISSLLTKEVNKAVSNLLYKITGDKSWRFDINTSVYSSGSLINNVQAASSLDRTRINFKVGKSLLNDNVIVTFGNDFDFSLGNSSAIANGQVQWLPDFNVEFVLSRDKKLRAIVFSKNSMGVNGNNFGRTNRQGISISYRKDFEKIFGRKEDDDEKSVPANTDTAYSKK